MQVGNYNTEPTVQAVDEELRSESDSVLESYARKFDTALIAGKKWETIPEGQRYAMRASNMLIGRQREAERVEVERKKDAARQARQDEANEVKINAYRHQARAAWIGDDKSFDDAWPRLLQDWQVENVRTATSSNYERLLARAAREF